MVVKKSSKRGSKKATKKGSKKATKKGSKKASKKNSKNKILFLGSYKGVKNLTKMKTFTIIDSFVANHRCVKNKLFISRLESSKKTVFYVIHNYQAEDGYYGSWYAYTPLKYLKLNNSKKQLSYKFPKSGKFVRINFTDKGWNQLKKFLS